MGGNYVLQLQYAQPFTINLNSPHTLEKRKQAIIFWKVTYLYL